MEIRYPLAEETLQAMETQSPAAGRTVYVLEAQRGSTYVAAQVRIAQAPLASELAGLDRREYPTFRYQEYESPGTAFAAACRAYHDLGGEFGHLDGPHPQPVNGQTCVCPIEGCGEHEPA